MLKKIDRFGLRNSSIERMSLESGLHPALSMDKIIVKFQLEMGCSRVATNSECWANTEYIRFWKFNEYQINHFLKLDRIPNTNSTIWAQLFEYQILNNEYRKLINAYCHLYFFHKFLRQKEKRRIWIFVFVAIWSFF